MSAFLPQQDPAPQSRGLELSRTRAQYQYNYTYVSPLAMVDRLPLRDFPSWEWLVQVADRLLRILTNGIPLGFDLRRLALINEARRRLVAFLTSPFADVEGMLGAIHDAIHASFDQGRPRTVEDYTAQFRAIGLPAVSRDYQDDQVFALMRLAGPNPVLLRRVDRLDDRFPVTEAIYASVLNGDTLAAAAAERRLYLADYALLENVENGAFPDTQKYCYAPLALFAVDPMSNELRPVAIQCRQRPGADNPIFTPADGCAWMIAKTIVEMADGNYHETITHLGRTHLLVEPFVIATCRHLASNHPLGLLLGPHFEGTLAINDMAQRHLINAGGIVDELLAGTIDSSRGLTVKGLQNYAFNDGMLLQTLRDRGVEDANALPNYPYRDDSLLYREAIRRWVTAYLELYYQSDADVQQDAELTAWCKELLAQDGGRVSGLGQNGAIGTRDYLADVVTHILFTSSVQHAAVNFPQYDLMSYVPNMPLACFAPAPQAKAGVTLQDYLNVLPPMDHAGLQLSVGYLLGSVHYTVLGHYAFGHFDDPRVAAPLSAFQNDLAAIDNTIRQRNQNRRPYSFLIASGIPQSINI
ncbi:MAG TPA: lipoxygenase family protein [Gemmataceae bacterium]|jgi:arachidonate 15-lipoxygenase